MRVGFRVLLNGAPVQGADVTAILPLTRADPPLVPLPVIPLPVARTDNRGEVFGVAPLALAPALYLMSVRVSAGERSISISGVYDEIENLFIVDLAKPEVVREKLPARIPGDGYFILDQDLLMLGDVLDVSDDPVRTVSSCFTCLYFLPTPPSLNQGLCLVNGRAGPRITISDAVHQTSRLYYPSFLHPVSPQRLRRDAGRQVPVKPR